MNKLVNTFLRRSTRFDALRNAHRGRSGMPTEAHDELLPEPEDDDVGEEEVAAEEEEDAINFDPRVEARDDWAGAMSEVRKRKQQRSREARSEKGEGDDDNGDEPSWEKHERQPLCSPRVFRQCIIMVSSLTLQMLPLTCASLCSRRECRRFGVRSWPFSSCSDACSSGCGSIRRRSHATSSSSVHRSSRST